MFNFKISDNIDINKATKKLRRDKHVSEIEKLARGTIYVGFPESAKNDEGLTIAKYARWNNYGTFMHDENGNKTGSIPPRPFFTEGFFFQKYKEERARLAKHLLKQISNGKISAGVAAETIGIKAVSQVRDSISTGPWAPNAPSTMARKLKKSKGKKANLIKPLIDTGDMINAVTYLVDVE